MKKILLVVTVISGLLMGGYFLLPQEKLNNLSQYLPAPFPTLLGISGAVNDSQSSSVATNSTSKNISQPVSRPTFEPIPKPVKVAVTSVIKSPDSQSRESVTSATKEDEKTVGKNNKTVKKVPPQKLIETKILINDSPEVTKIKKRLVKVQNRIKNFDDKNTSLKERFDKIIKENRALALEMKKINDQIKQAQ